MTKNFALGCVLMLASAGGWADETPPVQVVQLLDLVGITADEVDQVLHKEIMERGYRVIPMTEKPKDYFVLNILNSNVASAGAVATGLSTVVARYDAHTDRETVLDHSATVILVSGPDMETSARQQGLKALRAIVDSLVKTLEAETRSP